MISPAHLLIEAVSATCPACGWGSGPYSELHDAQAAVDDHNREVHDIAPVADRATHGPIVADIGGHALEFDIPEDAVVTEAVAVIAYQRMDGDHLMVGTYWATNEIPVHHALGLLTGAEDRIRDFMSDIAEGGH